MPTVNPDAWPALPQQSAILKASFVSRAVAVERDIELSKVLVAGWAGRDREGVEAHIGELEKLGVRRPSTIPMFYRVSPSRITLAATVQVLGAETSGEVEPVLLKAFGTLWVGVGSDHTDRKLETWDVNASKQICDKPIASTFWKFGEVVSQWDQLILRSRISSGGATVPYQEARVAALLRPEELIALYEVRGQISEGTLMFCGTIPVTGGIRPAESFSFEMEDPVLQRTIQHSYVIRDFPVSR